MPHKKAAPRATGGTAHTNGTPKSTALNKYYKTVSQAALYWLSIGVELVPLQPGTKHQVAGFGPYRKHITTEDQARQWFAERRCNLGVICAGDLVCFDFDSSQAWETWRAGPGAGLRTRIELTARGMHVFAYASGLAHGSAGEGIEVKAAGAVIMAAPSLHPTGFAYHIVDASPIVRIEQPYKLFPLLSKPTKPSLPICLLSSAAEEAWWARVFAERGIPDPAPLTTENHKPMMFKGLVATIKAQVSILDVARAMVPDLQSSDGGKGRWFVGRCPFHKDTQPSFWIDAMRGTWGCRSPQCEQRGTHDVINLESLRLGVDERETIRILALEVAGDGAGGAR